MNNKAKYHLINELPHIYELEDMMKFCRKYDKIYIYGHSENQEYLCKYLDMCGINVEGYVVSFLRDNENCFIYRELPICVIEDVVLKENTGIILGLSDKYYNYVIPKLRELGYNDYFMMSEWNKRSVAYQMKPRDKSLMTFEISLADHCNLSCQMCDHYSQVSDKWFVDMEQFENDMIQMGKIFDHEIAAISLLGGEPTLHPEIIKCIEITRREFPECELIILTNGIKLLELENIPGGGNLWETCKKYNVNITVTVYPVNIDYIAIEKKAQEYGVHVAMSSNIHAADIQKTVKISDKHKMDLNGSIEKFYCINCLYFNKFNVLKDGKLYMCPVEAHSDIFNKAFSQNLKITDKDYLDIYSVKDWKEIAEFSCNYIPFCSYCDLKNWGHHSPWKPSSKKIEEYI